MSDAALTVSFIPSTYHNDRFEIRGFDATTTAVDLTQFTHTNSPAAVSCLWYENSNPTGDNVVVGGDYITSPPSYDAFGAQQYEQSTQYTAEVGVDLTPYLLRCETTAIEIMTMSVSAGLETIYFLTAGPSALGHFPFAPSRPDPDTSLDRYFLHVHNIDFFPQSISMSLLSEDPPASPPASTYFILDCTWVDGTYNRAPFSDVRPGNAAFGSDKFWFGTNFVWMGVTLRASSNWWKFARLEVQFTSPLTETPVPVQTAFENYLLAEPLVDNYYIQLRSVTTGVGIASVGSVVHQFPHVYTFTFDLHAPLHALIVNLDLEPHRKYMGHMWFLDCASQNVEISQKNFNSYALTRGTMMITFPFVEVSATLECYAVIAPSASSMESIGSHPITHVHAQIRFADPLILDTVYSDIGPATFGGLAPSFTNELAILPQYADPDSGFFFKVIVTCAPGAVTSTDDLLWFLIQPSWAATSGLISSKVYGIKPDLTEVEFSNPALARSNSPNVLLKSTQLVLTFVLAYRKDSITGDMFFYDANSGEDYTQTTIPSSILSPVLGNVSAGDSFSITPPPFTHSPTLSTELEPAFYTSSSNYLGLPITFQIMPAVQPEGLQPPEHSLWKLYPTTVIHQGTVIFVTLTSNNSPLGSDFLNLTPALNIGPGWEFEAASTTGPLPGYGLVRFDFKLSYAGRSFTLTTPLQFTLHIPISPMSISTTAQITSRAIIDIDITTPLPVGRSFLAGGVPLTTTQTSNNVVYPTTHVDPQLPPITPTPSPSTPTNPCDQCSTIGTKQCNPQSSYKPCVCNDGYQGLTCSTSTTSPCLLKETELCQSPRNGYVKATNTNICEGQCTCYNAFMGAQCEQCGLDCGAGRPYSHCFSCGCPSGVIGDRCQCRKVSGTVTITGTNDLVMKTKGQLSSSSSPFQINHDNSQLDLTINSPFPSSLTTPTADDFNLYDIMALIYNGVLEPLTTKTPKDIGKLSITITPTPTSPTTSTTFTFDIIFSCADYNPHWTNLDAVMRQWGTFANEFSTIPIIKTLFNNPPEATGSDLTPAPETLPPPDDPDDEENNKPNGVVESNCVFLFIILSIAVLSMPF